MFAETVGADVQVVNPALDGGLAVGANVAHLSVSFSAGAVLRGLRFDKVSRLHIKPARGQHHTRGEQHGARAEQSGVALCSKRGRQSAQPSEGYETSDGDHPVSNL
jgi:hypothetical protein